MQEHLHVAIHRRRPDHHYVSRVYGASAANHLDIRSLPGFGELASAVLRDGRAMLYYDRLFTLYQAVVNAARLAGGAPAQLIEVGVCRGGGSAFIASVMQALRIEGTLHAFDTFEGHSGEDARIDLDAGHATSATLFRDTSYEDVKAYLASYPFARVHKGRFQERCAVLADDPVLFAHLDLDIYEPTAFALDFLRDRVLVGGAIVVDDYGFATCPGLRQAVDEFLASAPPFFALHQLTGQCVLVKVR